MDGNERKNIALGMPYGTANNKLRKSLLFDFAKRLNEDSCYRCEVKIESIDDFSIEHKIAWLGTINPVESFFDLNNIAFSHLSCNARAGEKRFGFQKGHIRERYVVPSGTAWCGRCQSPKPLNLFSKNKSRWTGLQDLCIPCRKAYRNKK